MKKLLLILSIICFSTTCANAQTDNVLQSVQIDSFKDTYNIILKADEKPETKRVITDDNKITFSLKGVRASEEMNTVYNATNIDSVTVEPTGNDSVNVSIQAKNASRSNLIFDTLDTPLGVLRTQSQNEQAVDKKVKKSHKQRIVLSHPARDYRPVYESEDEDYSEGLALGALSSNQYVNSVMSVFKDENVSNTISIMLIALIALCAFRLIRKSGKQNENMQIGLSQSLRDREMGLMQDMMQTQNFAQPSMPVQPMEQRSLRPEMNYGIRSYQSAVNAPYQQHGLKSPYSTSDIRRPVAPAQQTQNIAQPMAKPLTQNRPVPAVVGAMNTQKAVAQQQQRPVSNSRMTAPQSKMTSIDSMQFLNSMAEIYEKKGRADLAQGLKANINKAKSRV